MDITPYLGPILTAVIAFGASYAAFSSRLSHLETLIADSQKLYETRIDDLRRDVEKHNSVVERTFKLESDMTTAFKRIDELKAKDEKLEDKFVEFKIGGSE